MVRSPGALQTLPLEHFGLFAFGSSRGPAAGTLQHGTANADATDSCALAGSLPRVYGSRACAPSLPPPAVSFLPFTGLVIQWQMFFGACTPQGGLGGSGVQCRF
eukprot:1705362-Pyramimonas_sp.AAC.1